MSASEDTASLGQGVENPAAFPLHPGISPDWQVSAGMSLRDWFAGQALAGMMAHSSAIAVDGPSAETVAGAAYQIATAMLRERSK